jgi:hypothetical protein
MAWLVVARTGPSWAMGRIGGMWRPVAGERCGSLDEALLALRWSVPERGMKGDGTGLEHLPRLGRADQALDER